MPPSYPYPGCIVEFMEDNSVQIAMVQEDSGGKLRLFLPSRRETKLNVNRLLPWYGPVYAGAHSKEEMAQLLDKHRKERETKLAAISTLDLWEIAQGEIDHAPASWFAELVENEINDDVVAAYGRALLFCKTHFKYSQPDFQVYDENTVAKRLNEMAARKEREELAIKGNAFIRMLWDVANKKRALPDNDSEDFPDNELCGRIRRLLLERMADPESKQDDALWQIISKGLPDEPHIPLRLLMAWNVLPMHYNFWLDRADYAPGDNWWNESAEEVTRLVQNAENEDAVQSDASVFISIDGPSTLDIDDAFSIEKNNAGWHVKLAFANPAYFWPFGSELDKLVVHRPTSVYLPEGNLHMLPEILGTDVFSLNEKKERTAFYLSLQINDDGEYVSCTPEVKKVKIAANLRYPDVQRLIDSNWQGDNCALPFAAMLENAYALARLREQFRIKNGAVIMLRQEPELALKNVDGDMEVELLPEKNVRDAQRLVSELMILASAAIADWAYERGIPLLHRTQNVTLPKEYAGIWESPDDLARIMRSLIPSVLEIAPKPHAALGLARYAQITSPLRRYPDLLNVAQITHFIQTGQPKWNEDELTGLLDAFSPSLEGASQIQRYRPRYWKLLYFKQKGDQEWYDGVITDENENFITLSLPTQNMLLRGRRNLFDERAHPGSAIKVRVGKINPLLNEIHILETMPR